MNIAEICPALTYDENQIWQITGQRSRQIAYPEAGNEICSQLEDNSFWFQHRNNCIINTIRRYHPTGSIWDIGGGNGFVSKRIQDEGFSTILLEPGSQGALYAKNNLKLENVVCAPLQDLEIPHETIDAVGMFDVLEHIEKDCEIIDEIARILKPGGYFYLTVPAFNFLWSESDSYAQHFRRYNQKNLKQLLEEMFTIEYSSYFFKALTLPIFFLRTIPSRLGLSKIMSHQSEHGASNSIITKLLNKFLQKESQKIPHRCFSWGSSCILVARRK